MSYNFFAYLSRMRYIERWSLMRNAMPENIQEHSHMVAVLAHALGVIRRTREELRRAAALPGFVPDAGGLDAAERILRES